MPEALPSYRELPDTRRAAAQVGVGPFRRRRSARDAEPADARAGVRGRTTRSQGNGHRPRPPTRAASAPRGRAPRQHRSPHDRSGIRPGFHGGRGGRRNAVDPGPGRLRVGALAARQQPVGWPDARAVQRSELQRGTGRRHPWWPRHEARRRPMGGPRHRRKGGSPRRGPLSRQCRPPTRSEQQLRDHGRGPSSDDGDGERGDPSRRHHAVPYGLGPLPGFRRKTPSGRKCSGPAWEAPRRRVSRCRTECSSSCGTSTCRR